MSNAHVNWIPGPSTQTLPRPLPWEALTGVRTRRIIALCFDLLFVGILAVLLWAVLVFLTFGLALFFLPAPFAIIAFFYNGFTVSGWRRATPGQRLMDIEVRTNDGAPASFLHAAVHGVLFYLSWYVLPVVLVVSLLDGEKRCLHDMLSGVIVMRRPDGSP